MALYNNPYYQNYNYNPAYNPGYDQNQIVQNCGFVPIPSENDARSYPVKHGTSVTFRDENLPYIYIKTLGFGQLDSPIFERYRLVKEDAPVEPRKDDSPVYVTKSEFEELREVVAQLRKELGDE